MDEAVKLCNKMKKKLLLNFKAVDALFLSFTFLPFFMAQRTTDTARHRYFGCPKTTNLLLLVVVVVILATQRLPAD